MIDIEQRQIAIEVVLHMRADKGRREQGRNQQKYMQPPALLRCGIRLDVKFAYGLRTRRLNRTRRTFEQIFGEHGVEFRRQLRREALLLKSLQFLAGFEPNRFAWRDRHLSAGSRISADSGLARLHGKHPEPAKLDSVPLLERALHLVEDSLDSHLGLRLGDARLVYDFVDDVEFDQKASGRTRNSAPEFAVARSTR